jgi:gluconate kinase
MQAHWLWWLPEIVEKLHEVMKDSSVGELLEARALSVRERRVLRGPYRYLHLIFLELPHSSGCRSCS